MDIWDNVNCEDNIIIARNGALKEFSIDPYSGNLLIDLEKLEDFNEKRGGGMRFK